MKYNAKYDRYVDDDLVIYRWSKSKNKLVQCKQHYDNDGYLLVWAKIGDVMVHRMVYETFVNEIPQGYEIDHINTIRDDNRLENLRLCTHKENCNNHLTRKHCSEAQKGKSISEETRKKMRETNKGKGSLNRGKIYSEFGRKFKEHFGITPYENPKLYDRERIWYNRHNKTCRWEC